MKMHVEKTITQAGSVTIPKAIRAMFKLRPGTPLTLTVTDDGSILLKKSAPVCDICGVSINLLTFQNITVCRSCHTHLGSRLPIMDHYID